MKSVPKNIVYVIRWYIKLIKLILIFIFFLEDKCLGDQNTFRSVI